MKTFLVSILFLIFCIPLQIVAQVSQGKIDSSYGVGNNTFRLTIKSMQSVLTAKMSVKQFEKTMGRYERDFIESNSSNYDNTTHTTMPYNILYKDANYSDRISVSYKDKDKVVTSFTYYMYENNIRVSKLEDMLSQIKVLGYKKDVANERLKRAFGGSSNGEKSWEFFHPITKMHIWIYTVEYDVKYIVTISK